MESAGDGPVRPRRRRCRGLAAVSRCGRRVGTDRRCRIHARVLDKPAVQDFVAAYKSRYGLVPTQRSFFVFEATHLVVDAIRRAGSDQPAAIKQALKTTTMPSRLGAAIRLTITTMPIHHCR